MARWYGDFASIMNSCPHGLPWTTCGECQSWRLRGWVVRGVATSARQRAVRHERPTLHAEDRKPPPPTSAESKRRKRLDRKAATQTAYRRLAGLPEPEPEPAELNLIDTTPPVRQVAQPASPAPPARRAAVRSRVLSGTIAAPPSTARVTKRPWSTSGLRSAVTDGWFEGDALALFMYMDSRDLVLDFKDGHPHAVAEVLAWFRGTARQIASQVERRDCRYIVCAPRHTAGPPRASAEELCRELAASIPGLRHLPGALVRTKVVTSGYHDGQRSTEDQHLATIRYAGPDLGQNAGGFILFDDVFTSGATSRACRRVLVRATGTRSVLSLFITKTSARRAWQPARGVVQRLR